MSKENEAGTEPATRTEKTADTEQPAADGQQAAAAGEPPSDGRQQAAAAPRRRSRRFPVLTRDTARPEGGGRAVGGHHPAPYRQWPLLAVCAGVLVGLLVTVIEFRSGTLIIGLALMGGAVLRWAKPSVGMLAVRSRFTDMVLYGVLGLVIVLLALMAQPKPLLTVPFLDTIVHFTVR
ncbi:DUF3017 domain-containing protein [Streptomyces diacarni]|uniref:DUF3017 domain-containing protein n=1 Tax=Streptomyces diacarni TaxID=2800381 RepID=A0A367ESG1_9ACTN|nr:DUF3017 domain-containing protein [Streptomyces diacarni]RCG20632.1 DUF3017 domain-containing protein [Streptomyces diacarni]